ncbi:MAG: ATP-grasp domain-containing protein [Sandaracinus sp.]|nr:ATP-grasp domain-containing protein [Sandaracinus sp.]
MRWVLQSNLGSTAELARLRDAVRASGAELVEVRVVPFSDELPDVPNDVPTVFYGAASFVARVLAAKRWTPGVYFDEAGFDLRTWTAALGEDALNHGARIVRVRDLPTLADDDDAALFVRPTRDDKSLAGEVWRVGELRAWAERLLAQVHPLLDADLALCPPRAIEDEWRLFVVDGRVVTGSHYRSGETLDVHDDVPPEVSSFGEMIATRHAPSPVFVLDVARTGGALRVVEYNCLHGAGFYASDVGAVVRALNDYVASTTS